MKIDLAWDISDTLNGLMAIPNLIGLIGLSGVVIKMTKDYIRGPFQCAHKKITKRRKLSCFRCFVILG